MYSASRETPPVLMATYTVSLRAAQCSSERPDPPSVGGAGDECVRSFGLFPAPRPEMVGRRNGEGILVRLR